MPRLMSLLVLLLTGCTLVAPFGDLSTEGGGSCLMRPSVPPEMPLPVGMGTEVCNRVDDDGDGQVDTDLLETRSATAYPQIPDVIEVRGMRGSADDRVAVVIASGAGQANALRLAELFLGDGIEPVVATLVEGEVQGFDGVRIANGYAVAYSNGTEILVGVASDCDLRFGAPPLMVSETESTHVRVAAVDPRTLLVTWEAADSEIGAALVDVSNDPVLSVDHPALLADVGYTNGRDPFALSDGMGTGYVVCGATDGSGVNNVYAISVGGGVGPAFPATNDGPGHPFFGAGPFTNAHGGASMDGDLVFAFGDDTASGRAYVVGEGITAFTYGIAGTVLGAADSDTADVGMLLELGGQNFVDRIGAELMGRYSQDTAPITLAPESWTDLVGVRSGRTRYAVIGTRGSTVVMQRVLCP